MKIKNYLYIFGKSSIFAVRLGRKLQLLHTTMEIQGKKVMNMNFNYTRNGIGVSMEL